MSLMKISYDFKISKRLRRLNNFSWQKNDFFYDFGMRKIRMIFYARICLNIFSPINILYFIIFNFNKCENLASGWTSLSRRGWTSQLCSHSPGFRWAQAVERIPVFQSRFLVLFCSKSHEKISFHFFPNRFGIRHWQIVSYYKV